MTQSTDHTAAKKTHRINLRTSDRQEAVLRQAAEESHSSLSEFILGSAVEQAERVLADRRWFVATEDEYNEFVRLLEAPLPSTEKLARLVTDDTPVGKSFELNP